MFKCYKQLNKVKHITLLVLFLIFINVSYSVTDYDLENLVKESIDISDRITTSLYVFQSFLPDTLQKSDELYILNEQLKTDLSTINSKKNDLDKYIRMNDSLKIGKTVQEIKDLSYKIYAYECKLRLKSILNSYSVLANNYRIRGNSNKVIDTKKLNDEYNEILGDKETINLNSKISYFSTYESYYNECQTKLNTLIPNYQNLKGNYQPFEFGTIGTIIFGLLISTILWMCSWILFDKKFVKWDDDKMSLLIKGLLIILLGLFGLWIIPVKPYPVRFVIGGGAGFILFYPLSSILLWIKHSIFKIPKKGTPLAKLGIYKEYIDILLEEVETIEELLEVDPKNLSENTKLPLDTLIEFRKKGKELLNLQKKRHK